MSTIQIPEVVKNLNLNDSELSWGDIMRATDVYRQMYYKQRIFVGDFAGVTLVTAQNMDTFVTGIMKNAPRPDVDKKNERIADQKIQMTLSQANSLQTLIVELKQQSPVDNEKIKKYEAKLKQLVGDKQFASAQPFTTQQIIDALTTTKEAQEQGELNRFEKFCGTYFELVGGEYKFTAEGQRLTDLVKNLLTEGVLSIKDKIITITALGTLNDVKVKELKEAMDFIRKLQLYRQAWFKPAEEGNAAQLNTEFVSPLNHLGNLGANKATDLVLHLADEKSVNVLSGKRDGTAPQGTASCNALNGGMLARGGEDLVIQNVVNEFLEEMCGGSILTKGSASLQILENKYKPNSIEKLEADVILKEFCDKNKIDFPQKLDIKANLELIEKALPTDHGGHEKFLTLRIDLYKNLLPKEFAQLVQYFKDNKALRGEQINYADERNSQYSHMVTTPTGGMIDLKSMTTLLKNCNLALSAGDDLETANIIPVDVFLLKPWGGHAKILSDEFARNFVGAPENIKKFMKQQIKNIELSKQIHRQMAIIYANMQQKSPEQVEEIAKKIQNIHKQLDAIEENAKAKPGTPQQLPEERTPALESVYIAAVQAVNSLIGNAERKSTISSISVPTGSTTAEIPDETAVKPPAVIAANTKIVESMPATRVAPEVAPKQTGWGNVNRGWKDQITPSNWFTGGDFSRACEGVPNLAKGKNNNAREIVDVKGNNLATIEYNKKDKSIGMALTEAGCDQIEEVARTFAAVSRKLFSVTDTIFLKFDERASPEETLALTYAIKRNLVDDGTDKRNIFISNFDTVFEKFKAKPPSDPYFRKYIELQNFNSNKPAERQAVSNKPE